MKTSKMKLVVAFGVIFVILVSLVACSFIESKAKLYEQCYNEDKNRDNDDTYRDNLQCIKLAELEEKDDNFEAALQYYKKACEIETPLDACERLVAFAPKVPSFDLRAYLTQACHRDYDLTNDYACFEKTKIDLRESNDGSDLWAIIDEFDKLCEYVPKACDELNKVAQRQALHLSKNDDLKNLDYLCNKDKLQTTNICQMRDELSNRLQKQCFENDAKSCAEFAFVAYRYIYGNDFYFASSVDYVDYDDELARYFQTTAQKACERNQIESCMQLAHFYYTHKSYRNFDSAREFGKKACLSNAEYCDNLATIEISIDSSKAQKKQFIPFYHHLACHKLNRSDSCYALGKIYDLEAKKYGIGEMISYDKAIQYYKKACDISGECLKLSKIYFVGEVVGGKKVKRDLAKAKQYFVKSCDNNCPNKDCLSCDIKKMDLKELKTLEIDWDFD